MTIRSFTLFSFPEWIRTTTNRVRVWCATVTLQENSGIALCCKSIKLTDVCNHNAVKIENISTLHCAERIDKRISLSYWFMQSVIVLKRSLRSSQ